MVESRLLGSCEITDTHGRPATSVLAQPKRVALLAYLAVATPVGWRRRDTILALFWPDADAAHARRALNQAIHHLRSGLGSEVILTRGSEELAVDGARFHCDVVSVRECFASGSVEEALDLYRGDLLPGFHIDASAEFDEWLERERRALRDAAIEGAIGLARRAAEADLPTALRWARRACALAPLDESCSQQLMQLLIKDGNRAAAHAEFERLTIRLKREFDAGPSPQTANLLHQLEGTARLRADVHLAAPLIAPVAATAIGAASPGTASPRVTRVPALWRLGPAIAAALLLAAAVSAWWRAGPPVTRSAQSLAIAPFAVVSGDTELVRLGQNLVTTIGANMDRIGEIHVADGIAMLNQAERKGHLLSARDAMHIARSLGATSVVHGTLVLQGKSVRADAVLYDLSADGAEIASVNAVVPQDSVAALTDSLTWGLLRAVWSRGRAPTPELAAVTTQNPDALRAFLDGERLLAHNRQPEALKAFKRAVDADTTFWLAHFRYWGVRDVFTRGIPGREADSAVTRRMGRHVHQLPERYRLLVAAVESTHTVARRAAALQRVAERYPGDALAWSALADFLVHDAVIAGRDVKDALIPWEHAVRLMPGDERFAEHLTSACMAARDPCLRPAFAHYDSLLRADSSWRGGGPHRRMTLVLSPRHAGLVDSMIDVAQRDSESAYPFHRILFMQAALQRPDVIGAWDLIGKANEATSGLSYALLLDRVARGAWNAADSLMELRHRLIMAGPGAKPIRPIRLRALGELQGMLAPATRTAQDAMALAAASEADRRASMSQPDGEPAANIVVEANWIAGVNALLRGDSLAYRRQLSALSADTTAMARIAVRSLRGISMGRSGHQSAAAESLLVLERQHGERRPKVWTALAADRLLAARWLAEQKRFAAADSLLQFTDAWVLEDAYDVAHAIFALAQLQRSRNAEGMGNAEAAVQFASLFLYAFDKAPPSQRALIDEARSRVARRGRHDSADRQPSPRPPRGN